MVNIKRLVNKLKNNYGAIESGGTIKDPTEFVSLGNKTLDLMFDGGIPFGLITEFSGFSGSGKSLLLQQIIANAQKEPYNAIAILGDRENAFTAKRAEQLGIDIEKIIVAKPIDIPSPVEVFKLFIDSIEAIREQDAKNGEKSYIVVCLDSISSLDKEENQGLEKQDPGRKAQQIHAGFRRLLRYVDDRILVVFSNQITYKVGVLYGANTTTTGGTGTSYYPSIRASLEDRKKIVDPKKGNEIVGNIIEVEVVKTRMGPCYRKTLIEHYYKTGIDYYSGYCRMLVDKNYLQPKNKSEFDKFKQTTVLYKDTSFSEHSIEEKLKEFPELLFDKYPEYNVEK